VRTRTRTIFVRASDRFDCPKSSRGFFCYLSINKYFPCIISTSDCSKKSYALASVCKDCEVWRRMYNIMDKTEAMTFEIEKNHELYDKADQDYSLGIFCVQIHNYDFLCVWLYLRHDSKWPTFISQASKRRSASKSVDGFPRSGSCSIWMAKPLNSCVRVRVWRVRVLAVYKRILRFYSKDVIWFMIFCPFVIQNNNNNS